MKKRLFIAIPLPRVTETRILESIKRFPRFQNPIRFLSQSSWHITLIFLGYQDEDIIPKIEEALDAFSYNKIVTGAFKTLSFDTIMYGPPQGEPRMIWLTTDEKTSKRLGSLQSELDRELTIHGIHWEKEFRPFHGHITLARFEPISRQKMPPLELIFREPLYADTLALYESKLKRTGAEYTILHSYKLPV